MIRIIGGIYRHRLIDQPSLETTRCTKDIAKEGLFNSLGDISNKSFLDLFSGSGSIGIEAYSRGAKPVYLNDREVKRTIMRNLMALGISDIEVTCLNDKDCIKAIGQKSIKFDYVFLDPPYKFKVTNDYLENMIKLNVADMHTCFIIESDTKLDTNDFSMYNIKELKYGKSLMSILKRKA